MMDSLRPKEYINIYHQRKIRAVKMESYIYKTKSGDLGYFQINDGTCHFYAADGSVNYVGGASWPQVVFIDAPFKAMQERKKLSKDDLHRIMSSCLNSYLQKGSLQVISTRKIYDTGLFFARTNRGEPNLNNIQTNHQEQNDEIRAYENISESLISIFRTVEPERKNFKVYGNVIRELLIIACTEVEYLLRKFLTANGIPPKRKDYNTTDYITCLQLLKLNKYRVTMLTYPENGIFGPFQRWNKEKPTASLFWYDSYNKVKHDRGSARGQATLESLINAVAAIHILLESQYGEEIFHFNFQRTNKTIFYTNHRPTWSMNEISVPILKRHGVEWIGVKTHSQNSPKRCNKIS